MADEVATKPPTTGDLLEHWRTAERATAAAERLAAAAERAASAAERAAAAAERTAAAAMRTLEIARESGESAMASATEARAAAGDARSEAGTRTGEIERLPADRERRQGRVPRPRREPRPASDQLGRASLAGRPLSGINGLALGCLGAANRRHDKPREDR